MDLPDDQLLQTNDEGSLGVHDSELMRHIKTSNKMLLRSFKLFAADSQIPDEQKKKVTYVGKRKRETDDSELYNLKKKFVKTLDMLESTQDLLRNIYQTMKTPETIILSKNNGVTKCWDINEILNEINKGSIVFLRKDNMTNNELLLQKTESPTYNTISLHQDFVNNVIPMTEKDIIAPKDQRVVNILDEKNLIQTISSDSVSISRDIDNKILSTIAVDVIDQRDKTIRSAHNYDKLIQPNINQSKVSNIVSLSHVQNIENKISPTNSVDNIHHKNQKNVTIKNNEKLIQSKTKSPKMSDINLLSKDVPPIVVDVMDRKEQKIVVIKNQKYRSAYRYKNPSGRTKNINSYSKNKDILQSKLFKTHRSTKKLNYDHKRRIYDERR